MQLNISYLKELLIKKGWTEHQLAIRSGVSSATISRILTGKRGAGTKTLTGIHKAFPEESIERLFSLTK